MGKKKTTTTQTNKPIYGAQIEGAAASQQAAYNQQAPKIRDVSDNLMGLSDDLLARFREGDPAIDAAKGYITDTLSGDPAENPHLDELTEIARNRTRNDLQAKMGTRGLTGGSDYYGVVGRGMYEADTGLRYDDYNRQMDRRAQAAGMAPGVVAGEYIPVAAGMQAGQQGALLPLQAALANSAGVGGLLGPYQTQKGTQKQSGGLFGGLLGSVLSGWATGGFGGI